MPDSNTHDINRKLNTVAPDRRKSTLTQQPVIVQEHKHFSGVLHLGAFILTIIPWMMGLVIAQGGEKWLALFPPYAWYLTTELLMKVFHLIPNV